MPTQILDQYFPGLSEESFYRPQKQGISSIPQSQIELELVVALIVITIYLFVAQILDVKKISYIHESSAAILLGTLFGLFFNLIEGESIRFSEFNFFYFILPPIIFAAGYTLRRRNFIKNFPYIVSLGILGTFVSMTIFSGLLIWMNQLGQVPLLTNVECLVLASLLCATDTVAALTIVKEKDYPELNSILFGEGIVNDAVAILMFETIQNVFGTMKEKTSTHLDAEAFQEDQSQISGHDIWFSILHFIYLSAVSILIGIMFGALSAYISKKIPSFKEHPAREIIMIFVLAYLSYVLSEMLSLSGIITLFCCGFMMNHYTYYNLSESSKSGSVLAIQSLSTFSEAATYAYLGFAIFSIKKDQFDLSFTFILIGITLLARMMSVLIPMVILKLISPHRWLEWKLQTFIWYGGLIRGAIAFALTYRVDIDLVSDSRHLGVIRQNTLMLVVLTTVCFGSFMAVFAKILGISVEKQSMEDQVFKRFQPDVSIASLDELLIPENRLSFDEQAGVLLPASKTHNIIRSFQSLPPMHGPVHSAWKRFDERYIKKYLGGDQLSQMPKKSKSEVQYETRKTYNHANTEQQSQSSEDDSIFGNNLLEMEYLNKREETLKNVPPLTFQQSSQSSQVQQQSSDEVLKLNTNPSQRYQKSKTRKSFGGALLADHIDLNKSMTSDEFRDVIQSIENNNNNHNHHVDTRKNPEEERKSYY